MTSNDFAFRCHRIPLNNYCYVYPINDLCINPVYGSVCSAGGDGKYCIWDFKERCRINEREDCEDKNPLTACCYNYNGVLLAYATGYDWSKGSIFAKDYNQPKIYIHYLQTSHRKK